MSAQYSGSLHVLEAEFTEVDLGEAGVLFRVRAGVPGGDLKPTNLHLFDAVLLQVSLLVVLCHLMLLTAEEKIILYYLFYPGLQFFTVGSSPPTVLRLYSSLGFFLMKQRFSS